MKTIMGDYINRHEGAPSLEAIAWGLARAPRYAGHTIGPWTVAHHSLVMQAFADLTAVETNLGPEARARFRLSALLHDAHESITSDVPTEFKTPGFKGAQKSIDARIWAMLELSQVPSQWHEAIHTLDERALLAEAYVMTPRETYARIALDHALVPGTSRCPYSPDIKVVEQIRDAFPDWSPWPVQTHLLADLRTVIAYIKERISERIA